MFNYIGLALSALTLSVASPASAQEIKVANHKAPEEIKADPANHLFLDLSNGGTVEILLRPDIAPQSVYRIQQLATEGFYNGIIFHRVIPGFMAQGGDPMGTGEGGSELPDLQAEFNRLPHVRGAFAMARATDPNSANSQFYIMFTANLSLDFDYTVVGRVAKGMDVVDRIAPGQPPVQPTQIVRAYLGGPMPAAPQIVVEPAEVVDAD